MYVIKSAIVRNELENIQKYCEAYVVSNPNLVELVKSSLVRCLNNEIFIENHKEVQDDLVRAKVERMSDWRKEAI
jgi:hypothetical protein